MIDDVISRTAQEAVPRVSVPAMTHDDEVEGASPRELQDPGGGVARSNSTMEDYPLLLRQLVGFVLNPGEVGILPSLLVVDLVLYFGDCPRHVWEMLFD